MKILYVWPATEKDRLTSNIMWLATINANSVVWEAFHDSSQVVLFALANNCDRIYWGLK